MDASRIYITQLGTARIVFYVKIFILLCTQSL